MLCALVGISGGYKAHSSYCKKSFSLNLLSSIFFVAELFFILVQVIFFVRLRNKDYRPIICLALHIARCSLENKQVIYQLSKSLCFFSTAHSITKLLFLTRKLRELKARTKKKIGH